MRVDPGRRGVALLWRAGGESTLCLGLLAAELRAVSAWLKRRIKKETFRRGREGFFVCSAAEIGAKADIRNL